MPKALKSCPKSNKSPNLVTLHVVLDTVSCVGHVKFRATSKIIFLTFCSSPKRTLIGRIKSNLFLYLKSEFDVKIEHTKTDFNLIDWKQLPIWVQTGFCFGLRHYIFSLQNDTPINQAKNAYHDSKHWLLNVPVCKTSGLIVVLKL